MKERLDVLLARRGLAPSREKAKALIMSGIVYVGEEREDKAGAMVDESASISVRGEAPRYVSRGGQKLEKAISVFGISLEGLICMDIGASTGGFTDCMLKCGAKKVYAVDVGYGQLAWKLRQDERVVCMEKTNIRYLKPSALGEPVDFASADVSFISLAKVLPAARALLRDGGEMACLIKPQFEAGREKVGKKGVVKDPLVHEEVIRRVLDAAAREGFYARGLSFSPVKGPEGNIEYLAHLKKQGQGGIGEDIAVREVVLAAHGELDG